MIGPYRAFKGTLEANLIIDPYSTLNRNLKPNSTLNPKPYTLSPKP